MTKKISLVTGGAGFIGSHVVDHLLEMGHKVIILDDLSGGFEMNINKKAVFYKGSVTNKKILNALFHKYKFNYIYHLAAYAAEGLSHYIRTFNYNNNLIGSINLINHAVLHDIEHFVFTSSIAVYGSNQTPMREDLIPKPEDPYGVAKYAVELDLQAANRMFGLTYTIFRPHNVYGERQNISDPYRNVLGIFINNILQGKPIVIFGDGTQTRAFSYIDDVAPYIAQAVVTHAAKDEIFNIGADKPYSVNELATYIKLAMGTNTRIKYEAARKEVIHAYAVHDKVKRAFNITKHTDIETGIKKMVDWSKKNGPMKNHRFKNIEILKNMPESWQKVI